MWSIIPPNYADLSDDTASPGSTSSGTRLDEGESDDTTMVNYDKNSTENHIVQQSPQTITSSVNTTDKSDSDTFDSDAAKVRVRRDVHPHRHSQKLRRLKRHHENVKFEYRVKKHKKLKSGKTAISTTNMHKNKYALGSKHDPVQIQQRLSGKDTSHMNSTITSHDSLHEVAQSSAHEARWNELKTHLTVNDHMQQPVHHGFYNPNKSGLEKCIDKAIAQGNVTNAEELSHELSTRDFACRIARAANARDYMQWKQEDVSKKKNKRKKFNWEFEAKERWQMKGNM